MDEIKYLSTLEPFDKENHLVNNAMMKDIVVSKIYTDLIRKKFELSLTVSNYYITVFSWFLLQE